MDQASRENHPGHGRGVEIERYLGAASVVAGVVGIAEASAVTWMEQQEAKGWPVPAPNESERLAARSATLAWGGLRAVQQD